LPERVAQTDALKAMPVMLLGGSADRIAFMHARAVALLPQAQAVWLEGATDFVAEQEPVLFARHLNGFMAAHRGARLTTPAAPRTL
jgi:pimeloyl-ACP methyl ester carboxylesterase